MEIKIPGNIPRRQIPPEREVTAIMTALCERCGIDLERVRLTLVGGDRRKKFPQKGFKLMRYMPYAVQVYIGCKDDTVEANLVVRNNEGRALPGQQLHDTIVKALDGEYTIILNGESKHKPTNENGSNGIPHEQVAAEPVPAPAESGQPPSPIESALSKEVLAEAVQQRQPDESLVERENPTTEIETGEQLVVGTHYLDDLMKLHKVVCALVLVCEENMVAPFSFEQFKQALDLADIPPTAGQPASLIRTFLRRFIEVIPGTKPPRYLLKEAAIKYSMGKPSECPPKISQAARNPTGAAAAKKVASVDSTRETILRLKEISDEHNAAVTKLNAARAKLAKLKEVDIEAEERNIKGETASLQKRLAVLAEGLSDLAKRKTEIIDTNEEIEALTEEADDPEAQKAIMEMEALRKLLG